MSGSEPDFVEVAFNSTDIKFVREGHERFIEAARSGWETETFEFLDDHCRSDKCFVDIGAWIGLLSVYASRLSETVISVEPDPTAFQQLTRNLQLNHVQNATPIDAAIGDTEGELSLYYSGRLASSTTSALSTEDSHEVKVRMTTLSSLMPGKEKQCVLKIDIEGFEYSIIDQISDILNEYNCPCHFSLHPNLIFNQISGRKYDYLSRIKTWFKTMSLIKKISSSHRIIFEDKTSVTSARVFAKVCRPRYTKGFSVICLPRSA